MGGSIEYTRTEKKKKFIKHINNVKKKNAKICLNCQDNKEGYCNKYKGWCNKVNYQCNGFDRHYQEHLTKQKEDAQKSKASKKPIKNKAKKKKVQKKNSELGQVIKPNFDITKLTRKKDL